MAIDANAPVCTFLLWLDNFLTAIDSRLSISYLMKHDLLWLLSSGLFIGQIVHFTVIEHVMTPFWTPILEYWTCVSGLIIQRRPLGVVIEQQLQPLLIIPKWSHNLKQKQLLTQYCCAIPHLFHGFQCWCPSLFIFAFARRFSDGY